MENFLLGFQSQFGCRGSKRCRRLETSDIIQTNSSSLEHLQYPWGYVPWLSWTLQGLREWLAFKPARIRIFTFAAFNVLRYQHFIRNPPHIFEEHRRTEFRLDVAPICKLFLLTETLRAAAIVKYSGRSRLQGNEDNTSIAVYLTLLGLQGIPSGDTPPRPD
ncbi:hypothetical protein OE88DRAFT_699149 [Heliocybe sulcata]|uniref:Uncharacterized protein n=1 Tax=Heliocybe sulcata TaxID=5364 RepID=A0A5C3NFB1_9AGAM|nr:hypothetical protein OE88DRAFT_699149 [Heliocybe sulcata]